MLLAEDNEANQMVAHELLSRLGIELEIANNGREALDMVKAAPDRYAAVLMDVQMPEMDGLAATRAIRDIPMPRRLPILAMTANAMKADLDACLAAGMDDHVTKPIERKSLLQTLRRWLPARTPSSQGVTPESASAHPAATFQRSRASTSPDRSKGSVSSSRVSSGCSSDSPTARVPRLIRCVPRWLRATPTAVARHAHAIAGAAGNLGANALHAAAKALERAGRNGEKDLAALASDLEARATVVFRSIDTLRIAAQPAATEPGQLSVPAEAWTALTRLQTALGDFDLSAATSALAELDGVAMPGAAHVMAQLRRHIDGYEYDEARVIATRLLEQIGSQVP